MNRLTLYAEDQGRSMVNSLYGELSHRIEYAPQGNCPVELTGAFLRLCLAQSCGKCVPCRIGLDTLCILIEKILNREGSAEDLANLEDTARVIADTADCAIGFEAARFVLDGLAAFRSDYLSHIASGRCASEFDAVPCMERCPAHVDIPGYIALVNAGRYADAVRLIRKDNPFPSACALICEHPCEQHCRRGLIDSPVNIRGIKRAAIEKAGVVAPPACADATGKRVAVIGGGPAGLTAAYFLRLMGHSVTVYEQRAKLGGMLKYGIPAYRLPDEYLYRDIDAILAAGVDVQCGVSVGRDIPFAELQKRFDAVYVSIGAHSDKKLGIEGENLSGVMSAVELLRAIGDGSKPDFTGKRVVVIGGGNVAMDVTRTAKRLGASSVICAYRRRVDDMTALREEIDSASAEGCRILPLMAPVRVTGDADGRVTEAVFQPQVIGPYEKGRPKPLNADAPEVRIPCDEVIVAIGQAIDSAAFAAEGIPVKRGALVTGKGTEVADLPGVFAGGDCVSSPATVIRAIDAGKVAAANIDRYLGGSGRIVSGVEIPLPSYRFSGRWGRVNLNERDAAERASDFELTENAMTEEETANECARCLRCDHYGMGCFRGGRKLEW